MLKQKEDYLAEQKVKINLLENIYVSHFGVPKVREVKTIVEHSVTCSVCHGDGGFRGGCRSCEGGGWVDLKKEEIREVVEFHKLSKIHNT